jgi:hypothetical protein
VQLFQAATASTCCARRACRDSALEMECWLASSQSVSRWVSARVQPIYQSFINGRSEEIYFPESKEKTSAPAASSPASNCWILYMYKWNINPWLIIFLSRRLFLPPRTILHDNAFLLTKADEVYQKACWWAFSLSLFFSVTHSECALYTLFIQTHFTWAQYISSITLSTA